MTSLHRRHGRARTAAVGLPLRLLLDARVQLVRLPVGSARLPRSGRHARAAEGQGAADLRLDQPVHRAALTAVRRGAGAGLSAAAARRHVWQWDLWQPGMALVDFTNPAARDWYAGEAGGAAGQGVDCFKTDFGERVPVDVAYADGSDPERMHNYYTHLYNQTVFDVLREQRGERRGRRLRPLRDRGRPAVPGALGRRLRVDVRVDGRVAARRALARHVGVRVLEPRHRRLRGHARRPRCSSGGSPSGCCPRTAGCTAPSSYRVPWLFDEEAVDVLRLFTRLKLGLMPYLYEAAAHRPHGGRADDAGDGPGVPGRSRVRASGAAVHARRAICWSRRCSATRATSRTTCPRAPGPPTSAGRDGHRAALGARGHGFLSVPLLVRPGAVIPVGAVDDRPDYDYADGVTLRAYGLERGARVTVHGRRGHLHRRARGGHTARVLHRPSAPWGLAAGGREVRARAGTGFLSLELGSE